MLWLSLALALAATLGVALFARRAETELHDRLVWAGLVVCFALWTWALDACLLARSAG